VPPKSRDANADNTGEGKMRPPSFFGSVVEDTLILGGILLVHYRPDVEECPWRLPPGNGTDFASSPFARDEDEDFDEEDDDDEEDDEEDDLEDEDLDDDFDDDFDDEDFDDEDLDDLDEEEDFDDLDEEDDLDDDEDEDEEEEENLGGEEL